MNNPAEEILSHLGLGANLSDIERKRLVDSQVASYVTQSFLAESSHPDFTGFSDEFHKAMVKEANLLRKTLEAVLVNGSTKGSVK